MRLPENDVVTQHLPDNDCIPAGMSSLLTVQRSKWMVSKGCRMTVTKNGSLDSDGKRAATASGSFLKQNCWTATLSLWYHCSKKQRRTSYDFWSKTSANQKSCGAFSGAARGYDRYVEAVCLQMGDGSGLKQGIMTIRCSMP